MFRFENPEYLWLLSLVLLLAIIRFITYFNQKKRLRKFGDPELIQQLMPNVSRWRPLVKFCLLELALTMVILMVARPQQANGISQEKRSGIEVVIAMDISNSMRAKDVSPSRLDRAKMMVENLVENFINDKIGLIVFAGDAFVQLPITSDYVSAKMFLSTIDPSMIVNQGTDIAAAIQNIIPLWILLIQVIIREELSPDTGNYMIDNTGNTVMSRLNEQMCREIAQAGGGAYIHVDNNSSAQRLLDEELDKLEKGETTIYSDYAEQFQYAAAFAILLLIIEICILDRKNPLLKKIKLFKR